MRPPLYANFPSFVVNQNAKLYLTQSGFKCSWYPQLCLILFNMRKELTRLFCDLPPSFLANLNVSLKCCISIICVFIVLFHPSNGLRVFCKNSILPINFFSVDKLVRIFAIIFSRREPTKSLVESHIFCVYDYFAVIPAIIFP